MLITESQLNVASNSMSLLENMTYLSESESAYYPAMVPVVENSRLGAHMIALEDLCRFAESNGIFDLGAALQSVCESSQISPNSVAFSVHEENVIADASMAELVAGIMNEGVAVVAMPISENAPEYVCAEMAIEAVANGDTSLLEAYANDDWDYFAENTQADAIAAFGAPINGKKGKKSEAGPENRTALSRASLDNNGNELDAETRFMNSQGYKASTSGKGITYDQRIADLQKKKENAKSHGELMNRLAAHKVAKAASAADAEKQGQSIWQSAKNAATKGRKAIADKIASLNAVMKKWEAGKNAENAGFIAKLKGIVGKVIAWLTQKLHNAVRTSDQAAI